MITRDEIGAVILAGGRGRRMDGIEQGLLPFRGRPLVSHAIDVVEPHVGELIESANRRVDEYAELGAMVVKDEWPDARGPLAGIARGGLFGRPHFSPALSLFDCHVCAAAARLYRGGRRQGDAVGGGTVHG